MADPFLCLVRSRGLSFSAFLPTPKPKPLHEKPSRIPPPIKFQKPRPTLSRPSAHLDIISTCELWDGSVVFCFGDETAKEIGQEDPPDNVDHGTPVQNSEFSNAVVGSNVDESEIPASSSACAAEESGLVVKDSNAVSEASATTSTTTSDETQGSPVNSSVVLEGKELDSELSNALFGSNVPESEIRETSASATTENTVVVKDSSVVSESSANYVTGGEETGHSTTTTTGDGTQGLPVLAENGPSTNSEEEKAEDKAHRGDVSGVSTPRIVESHTVDGTSDGSSNVRESEIRASAGAAMKNVLDVNDSIAVSEPSTNYVTGAEETGHTTTTTTANETQGLPLLAENALSTNSEDEKTKNKAHGRDDSGVSTSKIVELHTVEGTSDGDISAAVLQLSSSAVSLPHPSKAMTGGEDAYFVACQNWLGVADGVGQWSLEGVNPGLYARELMENCERFISDCKGIPLTDPEEVLIRGAANTKSPGSSMVLVACFDGQALHVANIGNSGFIVIRNGSVIKRSSPMVHEFKFPVQIERGDDPSEIIERYQIELDEGDMIVTATDGLFDNLYEQDITSIVWKSLQTQMELQDIAQFLATSAQEMGRSTSTRSPFAEAAEASGYAGYSGGKLDDVTVILSYVQKKPICTLQ